jgi:FtsP/CotA-like multicopper oxidase with cupredoxin domain
MRYILYAIVFVFTLLNAPTVHAKDVHYYLTAGMNGIVRMHDGNTFPVWGFREGMRPMWSISVPGPTIRASEEDHVFLHFFNMSMLPHTIHPHGLDVPQDVDGVPQTSFEIPMMGTYTYDFIAPHAGTYGYHCHVHTVLHLQMGMYGTVVIESPDGKKTVWEGGPAYDIERIWGTGEFDSYWHENAGGFGMGMGMWRGGGFGMWMSSGNALRGGHHGGGVGPGDGGGMGPGDGGGMWPGDGGGMWPGDGGGMGPGDGGGMWPGGGQNSGFPFHDYNPDYFIVNGKSGKDIQRDPESKVEMDVAQTLLLRLVNIGGYLPHRFIFNGLQATAVSSDGRPLPIQKTVDEITLYPGERYDVIVQPDSIGDYQVDIEYLSIYDESVQGIASVPIAVRDSF